MLKITVEFDDVIDDVKIMGDFFLYPEESIKDLEKNLFGVKADANEKTIISILNDVIAEKNIQLIGITSESIAQTIRKAIQNAK